VTLLIQNEVGIMKKLMIIIASLFVIFSLTACSNRDYGTVGGAALGGVVGSAVTGGSTAGTIVGAVGGGYIGNQLSR
jgi:osmotically inducible lipoprotein OsmB